MNQESSHTKADVSFLIGLSSGQVLELVREYVEGRNFEAVNYRRTGYRGVRGCIGKFPMPEESDEMPHIFGIMERGMY